MILPYLDEDLEYTLCDRNSSGPRIFSCTHSADGYWHYNLYDGAMIESIKPVTWTGLARILEMMIDSYEISAYSDFSMTVNRWSTRKTPEFRYPKTETWFWNKTKPVSPQPQALKSTPVKPKKSEKTALYRHFDSSGFLLYVGISKEYYKRQKGHKKTEWVEQVTRTTIDYYPTRDSAYQAEQLAIKTENPIFNKAGR